VAVLLVRHAIAKARHSWHDDDDLRPLTAKGERQAVALIALLQDFDIDGVLSSPSVRCVDTVTPLATSRGLRVNRDEALAEGHGRAAAALVNRLLDRDANVVLCSHGDVVPDVVEALGFDCLRSAKGSTWVIEGGRATYLPAP
jgi:8-oxo-dGTP diphosphatase